MKWHLALLACLIGLTYANTGRQNGSHMFYIATSQETSAQSPRPVTEKNNVNPEYKELYDIYAMQATSGVYFKPIDENFGLKSKATTKASSYGQPYATSTRPTSNSYTEKYSTQGPHSTSAPFNPTSEKSAYETSTPPYESYTYQTSTLPSSSIKYQESYDFKPNENAQLRMDEPLFYSDYHYPSQNLSEKSTTPHYPPSYFATTASTTVKYDEDSVPIYYLAKSYYTSGYHRTSTALPSTKKPYTEKEVPATTTSKPYANTLFDTQTYSDFAPSTTKADDIYSTTTKPIGNNHFYQTTPLAYAETSAKPNAEYKDAYQTTPKSYSETSYVTTNKPTYEDAKDVTTTYPTKAQKPHPYKFSYAVDDKATKNDYSHQQESDGNVVTGSYRVLLPDGRVQVVTYRADKSGYTADVRYETATESSSSSPQSSTNY